MTQTCVPSKDRPRIMLDDEREAWYAEQLAKCDEACKASKQRVLDTAERKEAERNG